MTSHIVHYSGTTFSPGGRDFAPLNLLICGKLENRSIWVAVISKVEFSVESMARPRIPATRDFLSDPMQYLDHSPDGLLTCVEALRRGLNTDIHPPLANRAKKLY